MPHKDGDYVPRLWAYDNTRQAVVLTQKELKALRDQLNDEYLRRWSGYVKGVNTNPQYMDYTQPSTEFTDSDGKHIHRLPSWNGVLPTPTVETSDDPQYRLADGNVSNSYWGARAVKDFRGAPVWYSPMDRYIDGTITYYPASNNPPTVASGYQGPEAGKTFPLGTSEWRNNHLYQPNGFTDVTKDRSFKHLIDGLCNIVDIDKYFGTGIQSGDPIVPDNPVNYGADQQPYNSERTHHAWRQTGLVTNTNTPGNPATTDRSGSIKDWIAILRQEQRNQYYVRACNYNHWIWYFTDFTYDTKWFYSTTGSLSCPIPVANSFRPVTPKKDLSLIYESGNPRPGKLRNNYNPAYYGHRESYTSCLTACTGFCSQTCYHVCDEQCVYLCDDKCGYSCMNEAYDACGTVCIANCRDFCGGQMQEGFDGGNTCQASCNSADGAPATQCGGECSDNCEGFVYDEQACSDCVGYCSQGCDTLCIDTQCMHSCVDQCRISCSTQCVESGPNKQGCASSICKQGCSDKCNKVCRSTVKGGGGGKSVRIAGNDDWDGDSEWQDD